MSSIWLTLFLLLVGGFVLLLVEIFIIPGFGIAGFGGIISIIIAIAFAFNKMSTPNAVIFTLISTISGVLVSIIGIKIFPKTKFGKKMILNTKLSTENGFIAVDEKYKDYVGKTGITVTDLRPTGKIQVDDERLDVVSNGEYIKKGSDIIIIEVEGRRIVVKVNNKE